MLEIIKIGGGRLNLTLNLEINGWLNQVVFILIFKQTFLRNLFKYLRGQNLSSFESMHFNNSMQ